MAENRRSGLRSVRARTALAATLVVGAALSLGSVVLVNLLGSSLRAGVDSSVRLRADALVTLAGRGSMPKILAAPGEDTAFMQVFTLDGRVVAYSDNVQGEPPLVNIRGIPPGGVVRTVSGMPMGDQATFRVALRTVSTPAGVEVVASGVSLSPAQDTVRIVEAALAAGIPVALALVALTSWILTGRALAPVEAIRSEVEEISTRALDRRVPEPSGGDEIARLARTMNDMLARLEASMGRQRRFVADASHELRSPLAAALAELDVDLAHPETADRTETDQAVRSELERMRQIIEDLMLLARADESCLNQHWRVVDLGEIVRSECAHVATTTPIPINCRHGDRVEVVGDSGQLRRMVANLLSNAARHARSRVAVTLTRRGHQAELVVADDGPGIPAAEREYIFERFTRLDEARDRYAGGTGLGLAIVKEIVDSLDGEVIVSDAQPGARFTVVLPAVPGTPQPSSSPPVAERLEAAKGRRPSGYHASVSSREAPSC